MARLLSDCAHIHWCLYVFSGSAWNFDDDTDSTTSSETMTTVSDDISLQSVHKSPTQLYYTTPPKAVSIYVVTCMSFEIFSFHLSLNFF